MSARPALSVLSTHIGRVKKWPPAIESVKSTLSKRVKKGPPARAKCKAYTNYRSRPWYCQDGTIPQNQEPRMEDRG